MIAKTEQRLALVFRRAMLVAVAATACSTKGSDAVDPQADAGADGGILEGGAPADGGADAKPFDPCQAVPYTPNPVDMCGDYLRYPCGVPAEMVVRANCIFGVNDCAALCADVHFSCRAADGYCSDASADAADVDQKIVPDEAGAVVIDCATCPGSAGRVPAGLEPATVRARSTLGAYFASAARLEAASVTAFQRLREELAVHGAPCELLDAARAAERDEVKHTRSMARLARRHGGRYVRPRVAPVASRSFEAIAEENAIEGCARETFGALVATWQAAHIEDRETAGTLAAIAEDETRHAALSWAIARWSLTKLDAAARARLQAAWSRALDDVASGTTLEDVAGLPSRASRARLAGELRELWSELGRAS